MLSTEQNSQTLIKYLPAQLKHNGVGWHIEYSVHNPIVNKMERKRIKLNELRSHSRTLAEFRMQANEIVCTINTQLAGGWSPFGESANSRYYTPLTEMLHNYLAEKEKELREESMRTYKSVCGMIEDWANVDVPNCKTIQFTKMLAVQFMDYLYNKPIESRADPNSAWQKRLARAKNKPQTKAGKPIKTMSANTYNNYLKIARLVFSWAVEQCYMKENPFDQIKPKKKEDKQRDMIDAPTRQRILRYFEQNKPEFLTVCHLVFTGLIRPIEISRIKVNQINLDEGYIYLPASDTKNGHARTAPLSGPLCAMIGKNIDGVPGDYYLIGRDYLPAPVSIDSDQYTRTWNKMREELNLSERIKLYSLRDTCINLMLTQQHLDPLTVMQAADHHDLAMTTTYANHINKDLVRTLNENAPTF